MRRFLPAFLGVVLVLSAGCGLAPALGRAPAASPSPTLAPPPTPAPVTSSAGGGGSLVRLLTNIGQQTYTVQGKTPREIRSSLNQAGPTAVGEDRRYDALTNWTLQWSFRFQSSNASCSLVAATLELDVTTILPQLASPEAASSDTFTRWQRFVSALATHEQGHVDRELAGANDLRAEIEQTQPAATCSDLGQALNVLGDQEVEHMKAGDAVYDEQTGHGRSQRAIFP